MEDAMSLDCAEDLRTAILALSEAVDRSVKRLDQASEAGRCLIEAGDEISTITGFVGAARALQQAGELLAGVRASNDA
jgi:hypothetical protein